MVFVVVVTGGGGGTGAGWVGGWLVLALVLEGAVSNAQAGLTNLLIPTSQDLVS